MRGNTLLAILGLTTALAFVACVRPPTPTVPSPQKTEAAEPAPVPTPAPPIDEGDVWVIFVPEIDGWEVIAEQDSVLELAHGKTRSGIEIRVFETNPNNPIEKLEALHRNGQGLGMDVSKIQYDAAVRAFWFDYRVPSSPMGDVSGKALIRTLPGREDMTVFFLGAWSTEEADQIRPDFEAFWQGTKAITARHPDQETAPPPTGPTI